MNTPKISVLVPLYNRKHYIAQCLNSVLGQTFQDFEIIVCDDGSTDGSHDFVAKYYAAAISAGKIRLLRNDKNRGEFPTDNRLLREATGKYVMILHSDDLYVPQALEHMHQIAEHFQADVVHASRLLFSPRDSLVAAEYENVNVGVACWESNPVDTVTLMPDGDEFRFNEWSTQGTFHDTQHNIFRRDFLTENDLCFDPLDGNIFFTLQWLMRAKVYVKTPEPFYVYRISPDSLSNSQMTPERITKAVSDQIELSRRLDKYFATEEFFRDNPERQYRVRSKIFSGNNHYWIQQRGIYKDGVTPELHSAVEAAFRKYLGDDAPYPTFLFHWINAAICGRSAEEIITPPPEAFDDDPILRAA